MQKSKKKKRAVTLIEMMIVMFLIAIIIGVIAYNYRGSLDEGKAFKTKIGIDRLETILNLRVSEDPDLLDSISTEWQDIVKESPLVQNANALLKDGWGNTYEVHTKDNGIVEVFSKKYKDYQSKNKTLFKADSN